MILLIILLILALVILYLLFAPIYLVINTNESRYEAGLTGVIKVWISKDEIEKLEIRARILFIGTKVRPFNFSKNKVKASTPKKAKKKRRKLTRKRIKTILKLFWNIVMSFKLKQLKLNIDTGDVIQNAHLIPVFSMVYKNNVQLSINFEDKNEFILHFENNIGTIIFQIVSAFIKNKLNK